MDQSSKWDPHLSNVKLAGSVTRTVRMSWSDRLVLRYVFIPGFEHDLRGIKAEAHMLRMI